MNEIVRVTEVEPLEGYRVQATFSDGAVKEIDLTDLFSQGGVFEPIRSNRELFERVRINPESGTVEWPGEVDLDPEVLYGRFEPDSRVEIKRRILREPAHLGA